MKYLNVFTSNIFRIISIINSATRESITSITIADKVRTLSTISITTITTVTITIEAIYATTSATSVIIKIINDTRGCVSAIFQFIRIASRMSKNDTNKIYTNYNNRKYYSINCNRISRMSMI